jgi:hypothetical protein
MQSEGHPGYDYSVFTFMQGGGLWAWLQAHMNTLQPPIARTRTSAASENDESEFTKQISRFTDMRGQ